MRARFRHSVMLFQLAVAAAPVHAAEWKIEPHVALGAGYNDNIRMSTDNEVSSAEAKLSPSAVFSVNTPTSGLSGDLRFDFRRYEADSDLNDNNVRFSIESFHRMERSEVGLDLDLIRDTTLDSQLENTGLVFDRIRRRRIDASPSWSYSFDERTLLRASYNYSDVKYDNAGGTGFVDFTLNSGQLSLSRTLSERSTASVTLSRTQSDNTNNVKSTNTNLQGGAAYQFSQTLSTSLFAGVRRTEIDYSQNSLVAIYSGSTFIGFIPVTQAVTNSDWGYTFNASVTKSFLRGQTTLSASRDISNDINGNPVEVDRFRWLNLYRFSETLSGNLDFQLYNSQTSSRVGQNLNRDYYTIEPRLNWKFRQFWSLSASYRYIRQTYESTKDEAIQNAAYLTLSYHWPRIAVSR